MNRIGDLSFMNADSVMMIKDMCQAVSVTANWDNLKEFTPGDGGFTFGDLPAWFADIDNAMEYKGHSGGSYGWTMRLVHYIARYGWENFVAKMTSQDYETKQRLRRMELPTMIEEAKSVAYAWRTRLNNSTNPEAQANLKDRLHESQSEVMALESELLRFGN
jgi:hypothetical protein